MKDQIDSIRIQPLGDVVDLISGQHIAAKDYNLEGRGVPYLTGPSDFGVRHPLIARWTEHPKKFARKGDILITVKGSGVGSINVVDIDEVAISRQLMAIRARKAEPRFIELFLSLQGNHFQEKASGAAIPGLSRHDVLDLEVPLPPLEEQKRIVAVLDQAFDALDRARAHAEANLADAAELFDRSAGAIFESLLSQYPDGALSNLTGTITKGSSPKWQGISYVESPGILFVTSENVGTNVMDFTKTKYVEEAFNEKDRKSILRRGDVLTNIVGASIGRTAVFDRDDVANINQAVCLMRCDQDRLNNFFLAYLLNSPYFKKMLHEGEVNMARANLSLTFFREFRVPLPPISIQRDVVEAIDALRHKAEEVKLAYSRDLADIDDLRQSLLQKAFSGQLIA